MPRPVSMKISWMSLSLQGMLLTRYSLSPERYSLLVTDIWLSWANWGGKEPSPFSKSRETSAMPRGLCASVPLKITSSICRPLSSLALCSPMAQRIASTMLLFPHPFGPTMALKPSGKGMSSFSGKDLKPTRDTFLIFMDPSKQGHAHRLHRKPSNGAFFT